MPDLSNAFAGKNLALNKATVTSSIEGTDIGSFAVDDDNLLINPSRWTSSNTSDDQWIYIDLGYAFDIDSVVILWETAYAQTYKVQFSEDGSDGSWKDQVADVVNGNVEYTGHAGIDIRPTVGPDAKNKRFVRILGLTRPAGGQNYGYSIYNIRVLGTGNYKWSPDDGTIDDASSTSPKFTPLITDPEHSTESFTYTVNVPDACLGQTVQTFKITNSCTLPVTFIHFSVSNNVSGRLLTWQTASEENASHFVIEQFVDGSFLAIGNVTAMNKTGIHSYSFQDPSYLNGTIYYRIVEYDLNGIASTYTALKSASSSTDEIVVYPNPTTGILTVTMSSSEETEYTVYNTLGQTVFYTKGNTSEQHIDLSSITTGAYMIQVSTAQHQVLKKIIKN
ncbi:MAG: discoidin domain-containing protein [Cytophagales bacterium]|nr:discoidin domain-containing protein [Cytophaga sp.]